MSRGNALTPELRNDIRVRLHEMSKDNDIWSLIITGAGDKFFAAGADYLDF